MNESSFTRFRTSAPLLLAFLLSSTGTLAEPWVSVPNISLEFAQKAANDALKQCQTDGHRVAVTIVDAAGVTVISARADGAGPHTLDSSRRKAYTAASLRQPTQMLAEHAASSGDLAALRQMNDSILLLGGGFPIRTNGIVIGGIGVGGAPGAKLDEACARAGLQAIGADLYPSTPK